jgi:hypothetical protein
MKISFNEYVPIIFLFIVTDRMYYPINNLGSVDFLGMGGGVISYNISTKMWTMMRIPTPAVATTAASFDSFMLGKENAYKYRFCS